jgi:hypothetical protein
MQQKFTSAIIDLSDIFGFDPFGRLNVSSTAEGGFLAWVKLILTLVLVGLFIVWIVMAALMGIKFITSLGNPDKVGEASRGFKNLFIGITVTFLFIILILWIANFFEA